MRLEVTSLWRRLWDWNPQPAEPVQAVPIPVAEIVEPPEGSERREIVRQPCHREAWLRPVTLIHSTPWHAIVLDLSSDGIGLAIERPVHVGAFFAIELPDPMLQNPAKVIRGQVIHAASRGHNYWQIGCHLETPFTTEDLEALLAD